MTLDTQEMQRIVEAPARPHIGEMAPTWHIREAVEGDAAALRDYYERMATEELNNTSLRYGIIPQQLDEYQALIRRYQQHSNSCLLVVIDTHPTTAEERIIGQLKLTGSDTPMTSHVVEISINVHGDYRGQGVGTALMRHGITWAWLHGGIYRMQLEVLLRNTGALRMYERLGFQVEGRRVAAYHLYDEADKLHSDAYVMALLLPRRGPRR